MLGGEPGQVPERALRQVERGDVGKPEERAPGGVGQVPVLGQLVLGPEFPGEAVVVSRVDAVAPHRRGAHVPILVIGRGRLAPRGQHLVPRQVIGHAERHPGGQLGIEGSGEIARDRVLDGPGRGDHARDPPIEQPR